MSLPATLVLFLLGLIMFWYFCFRVIRWLFVKWKTGIYDRLFAGMLVSTALTFFMAVQLLPYAVMFGLGYEKQRKFSRERWCAEPANRYEMRKHIIKSGLLIRKSKQETQTLLDPPTWGSDSLETWTYHLGGSSAGFGIAIHYLNITFRNDTVFHVQLDEVID